MSDAPHICAACAGRIGELEARVSALESLLAPAPRPHRPRAVKPKCQDGRRNNGGRRPGAGRKPKYEEMRALIARLMPQPTPLPRREEAAAKLLRDVAARIPAHYPTEIREEAAQAIVFDLVTRKLTRKMIDARTVRRYVSAAYGLRSAWRFRSLDAPVSADDARTLGELLVA
jgi:hypothetical protein